VSIIGLKIIIHVYRKMVVN